MAVDWSDFEPVSSPNAQSVGSQNLEYNPEDFDVVSPQVSPLGAATSGAAESVGGAGGALAGGIAGAELGSVLGPWGTVGGGVIGGIIGGAGGSFGQRKVEQAVGAPQSDTIFGNQYREAAEQQHPYYREVGSLLPQAAAFGPGASSRAARAVSAGIFGGTELGTELTTGNGQVDPGKVAIATGAGAVMASPRPWVTKATGAIFGRPAPQTSQGNVTGRPNVPQSEAAPVMRQESNNANDVTSTAIGATNDNAADTNTPDEITVAEPNAATIATVRSDTDYSKNAVSQVQGVPSAPSTTMGVGNGPAADIAAAIKGQVTGHAGNEGGGEVGLGNQQQIYRGEVPTNISQIADDFEPVDTSGFDRRVQQLPGTWQRRAADVSVPKAQQGQLGELFAEQEPPLGPLNPDRQAAPQQALEQQPAQNPAPDNLRTVRFMRHGETQANADNVVRGWDPVTLNEDGAQQAQKLGQEMAKQPPTAMVNSDLPRAQQTADAVSQATGVKSTPSDAFRTWNMGEFTGQPSKEVWPQLKLYQKNPNLQIPGGESLNQFKYRWFNGLLQALQNNPQGDLGVLSHNRAFKLLEAWQKADFPEDGSIDLKTFNAKGDNTGTHNDFQIPVDKLQAAVENLRQETQNTHAAPGTISKPASAAAMESAPGATPARPEPVTTVPENRAPSPMEPVPVAKTKPPQVQRAIDALRSQGMQDRAAQLENMELNDAFKAAEQINKRFGSNAPENRQKLGNIQVRSSKDLARKQGALDAVKAAYDQFPPVARENQAATLDRAKQMVDHATQQYGGNDPVAGYKPRVKPPEYQLVQSAQKLLRKPTTAAVKEFLKKETTLRGEQQTLPPLQTSEHPKSLPELEQETARINADIEKSKRPTAEMAEQAKAAEAQGQTARYEFPDVPQDTTAIAEDRQSLHDYINSLGEDDYRRLENVYRDPENPESGNLQRTVELTGNPHRLQMQMEAELERGPGNMDIVNAQDEGLPVAKREKVFAGEAPKASEGAAGEAKSRKDLIAEYNRRLQAGELLGGNKAPDLLEHAVAQNRLEPAQERASTLYSFPGQMQPVLEKVGRMLKDEAASLNIHRVVPWLTGGRFNLFSPQRDPALTKIPGQISDWFNKYTNKGINTDMKLNGLTVTLPEHTNAEWDRIGRAIEDRTVDKLPQNLQDTYLTHLKPLQADSNDALDMLQQEAPGLLDKIFPGFRKDFLPRYKLSDVPLERQKDPTAFKRSLSTFRGSAQPRDFFTLDNGQGTRLLFHRDEDGDISILRNGAPQKMKNLPASFTGDPGQQISLNVKGKPSNFTVDHATVPEIEAGTRGAASYVHNPFFVLANQNRQLNSLLDTVRVLEQLKDDPVIKKYSYTGDPGDKPVDYRETILPQMAKSGKYGQSGQTVYYHPRIANMLDDFARPGFNDDSIQSIRNLTHKFANTLYFFGSPVHVLNEAHLWATARGFDWLKPTEWGAAAKEFWDSAKSVYTQDPFNDDIRKAGGNPMLAHTLLGDGIMKTIANKIGVDLQKRPSAYDPFIQATGVDPRDIANSILRASNKGMWYANDLFLQMEVRRALRQNPNMTVADAVHQAHEFISDYRERQGTVMGSRFLQKFLMDPSTSWFGRYHVGLWRSLGNMVSKTLGPNATPKQRAEGAGQMLALAGLAFGLQPLISQGIQKLTGNENAEFGHRGLGAIVDAAVKTAQNPTEFPRLARQIITPSIPYQALPELLNNRQLFTGKNIMQEGVSPVRQGAQAADYLLKQAVPPYATASRYATRPDASPLNIARGFLEGSVGINEKSPGSVRHENQIGRTALHNERSARKHPGGVLEEIYNNLR